MDYMIRRDTFKVIKIVDGRLIYHEDSVLEGEDIVLTNKYDNRVYTLSKVMVLRRFLNNEHTEEQVFIIPYHIIRDDKGISEDDYIYNLLCDYAKCSRYLIDNWEGTLLTLHKVEGWYDMDSKELSRIKAREIIEEEGDTQQVRAAKWMMGKLQDVIVDETTNIKITNFKKQIESNSISQKKLEEIANIVGAEIKLAIKMNGEEKTF